MFYISFRGICNVVDKFWHPEQEEKNKIRVIRLFLSGLWEEIVFLCAKLLVVFNIPAGTLLGNVSNLDVTGMKLIQCRILS